MCEMALSVGSKKGSIYASASGLHVGVLWPAPSVPLPCSSVPMHASATSAGGWGEGEARAGGVSNRDLCVRPSTESSVRFPLSVPPHPHYTP